MYERQDKLFGNIANDKMNLNEWGMIASKYWEEIPNHFDYTTLDKFVVMPNHVHGIIVFDRTKVVLSKIIQQYKASVSRFINKTNNVDFRWQRSYYDRVIRNEKEFTNIQSYIFYNEAKWQSDSENKLNRKGDKNYYLKLFNNNSTLS